MSQTGQALRTLQTIAFAAGLVAAGGGLAVAQQRAADLMPLPGEQRVTLSTGTRTVAFPAKTNPIARETIPFESKGHAVTEEGRQAMQRLQEALFRQPGGSLILVVYGENESLAFQRARTVRGELAERYSMDPARIIATGRRAEGHTGDLAIVDVFGADATRCGGCAGTPFRTIAAESGTTALVTSFAEALQDAKPATPATAATPPRVSPARAVPQQAAAPAPGPVQPASPPRTPAPALRESPTQLAAPAPRGPATAPREMPAQTGCERPKIIIDDYYPGGPLVPCRVNR